MKKTLAIFLSVLFLLPLAACARGGDPASQTDPANPTAPDTYSDADEYDAEEYEEETTHPGALPVDNELVSDVLNYDFYNEEEDAGLPVLNGWGMDTADESSPVADITIRVKNPNPKLAFAFVLRSVVSGPYANGGQKPMVWQHARYGSKTLLSVSGYKGENVAYYFYDTASGELSLLGMMSMMRFLGNYFLVRPADESGSRLQSIELYNWNGEKVHTYSDVLDLDRWQGDLYLLAGEPLELQRVKEDAFYDLAPGFEAESLCSLGDYTGFFSVYRTGILGLKRNDGGDFRTCGFSEAPELLKTLAETPAEGHAPIKESCAAFSVTLPGFWNGLYTCEAEDSSLTFSMVMPEGEPVLLFQISVVSGSEAVDHLGMSVFVYRYLRSGAAGYVTVTSAPSLPEDAAAADTFAAMLDSMDYVIETMRAEGGAKLKDFETEPYLGRYTGENAAGETYTLALDRTDRNILLGELEYIPAQGNTARAEAYIVMFDNVGYLVWNTFDGSGDGAAVFENGGVTADLNGPENTWVNTDDLFLKKSK